MAYSEIINEIQEQIDEITAHIASYNESITLNQTEIAEFTAKIADFEQQVVGLQQLKTNAQALIDTHNDHNINLNINVNGSTVSNSSTSLANDGPFK